MRPTDTLVGGGLRVRLEGAPDGAILCLPHAVFQASRTRCLEIHRLVRRLRDWPLAVVGASLAVVGFVPAWLRILEGPPFETVPPWVWCGLACHNVGIFTKYGLSWSAMRDADALEKKDRLKQVIRAAIAETGLRRRFYTWSSEEFTAFLVAAGYDEVTASFCSLKGSDVPGLTLEAMAKLEPPVTGLVVAELRELFDELVA